MPVMFRQSTARNQMHSVNVAIRQGDERKYKAFRECDHAPVPASPCMPTSKIKCPDFDLCAETGRECRDFRKYLGMTKK